MRSSFGPAASCGAAVTVSVERRAAHYRAAKRVLGSRPERRRRRSGVAVAVAVASHRIAGGEGERAWVWAVSVGERMGSGCSTGGQASFGNLPGATLPMRMLRTPEGLDGTACAMRNRKSRYDRCQLATAVGDCLCRNHHHQQQASSRAARCPCSVDEHPRVSFRMFLLERWGRWARTRDEGRPGTRWRLCGVLRPILLAPRTGFGIDGWCLRLGGRDGRRREKRLSPQGDQGHGRRRKCGASERNPAGGLGHTDRRPRSSSLSDERTDGLGRRPAFFSPSPRCVRRRVGDRKRQRLSHRLVSPQSRTCNTV